MYEYGNWSPRIAKLRLVKIDRNARQLTLEVYTYDPVTERFLPTTKTYDVFAEIMDKNFEQLRKQIGNEIRLKIANHKIVEVLL